jgi:cytochrome c
MYTDVAGMLGACFYLFPLILETLMLNKWNRGLMAAVLGFGLVSASLAEERGTKDEAVAMTNAAVDHVKKVGVEQAFKDFTEDKATWTKKDLYVMAYNHEGTCMAHGANGKLVGKNLVNLKDANGKEIIKEFTAVSTGKGKGWVDYEWAHPQTKKVESKSTYAVKLAGYEGWVGVGIYR